LRGYDILSMRDACQRIVAGGTAHKFVCLTFDDGYRDNYRHAYAVASHYGIPITVFVTTGFVSGTCLIWWLALEELIRDRDHVVLTLQDKTHALPTRTLPEKQRAFDRLAALLEAASLAEQRSAIDQWRERYGIDLWTLSARETLSWAEIKEMDDSGLVEFGAHTAHHVALRSLTLEAARTEMSQSRYELAMHLRRPVEFLAYPFGKPEHAADREYALAAELGFIGAVTTIHGILRHEHRDSLYALPRISVGGMYASIPALEVFLSGASEALYRAL
jgi:peptidoglycan/xylan/chitin deacetylase (PgdA/CDA1 family)